MKVISRLAPLGLIVALVVLIWMGSLIARSPVFFALQLPALVLNLWGRSSFPAKTFRVGPAPAGEAFIHRGPYRVVRHPMYAAALLFFWAAIADHPSPVTIAIGAGATALALVRVRDEDALLRARYPEYAEYARTTKALVPGVY